MPYPVDGRNQRWSATLNIGPVSDTTNGSCFVIGEFRGLDAVCSDSEHGRAVAVEVPLEVAARLRIHAWQTGQIILPQATG
jgi:hypothetical protein